MFWRSIKNSLRRVFPVLSGCVVLLLAGCVSSGVETAVQEGEGLLLKDIYKDFFPIGAAVAAGETGFDSFQSYPKRILGEFNSLTAENAMKPSVLQPTRGRFAWKYADRIVQYAEDNNMKVRGHTLVWHNQTPQWMFLGKGTQEERKAFARKEMKAYISAVVGRYSGRIYCWDVVNEALSEGGWYRVESPWYQAYGDQSYIQDAFDFARQADPDCRLFYNDYNLVYPHKREMVIEMIEELDLKSHGLTGVGIQAHWNLTWPTIEEIEKTIDLFYSHGLEVQITELDINCYDWSDENAVLPYSEVEQALADRYRAIFDCFRRNSHKLSGVTFWGVADDHTWLDHFYGGAWHEKVRKNYPLLFGISQEKKKSYHAITRFQKGKKFHKE